MNNEKVDRNIYEGKQEKISPTPLSPLEKKALRGILQNFKVAVVGSLNVDRILDIDGSPEDDSTLIVRTEDHQVGGHAGNCAAALASLGFSVRVIASIGMDSDGDQILSDLNERKIDTAYVRRVRETPTGHVTIPLFKDQHYMLMYRGANEKLSAKDVKQAITADVNAVVMFDPSPSATYAVAEMIHRSGPSVYTFWNPGGIYARSAIFGELMNVFRTIIVNRHEFSLIGSELLRQHSAQEANEIVVTLGKLGSMISDGPDGWNTVDAPMVNAIDPTGAGDVFTAAYVLGKLANLDSAQRLWLANTAGSFATTAIGAKGRLPKREDFL